jgi:hypothetical protein
MSPRGARACFGVATLLGLVAGCATARIVTEKRGDQRYLLRCQTPLPVCLAEGAEAACEGRHYVVERALNEVNERGTVTSPTIEHTSAASAPVPAPASPAAATAGQRVCTPGASQACVGPGGCQGGQACLVDGAAFGPCDCGGAAAPPP